MAVTLNPANVTAGFTLSGGDLTVTNGAGTLQHAISTDAKSTGKWYAEVTNVVGNSGTIAVGLSDHIHTVGQQLGVDAATLDWCFERAQHKWHNNVFGAYGAAFPAFTSGDIISVLWDADAGSLEFWVNGVSQGVAYASGVTGTLYLAVNNQSNTQKFTANFGATAFTYLPPAGYNGWDSAPGPNTLYAGSLSAATPALISGASGIIGTAPRPALLSNLVITGVNGTAPVPTLLSTIVSSPYTTFAGAAPAPTLVATGVVGASGDFAKSAPAPRLAATSIIGEVITVTATAPKAVLAAVLDNPTVIWAVLRAPAPTLVATLPTGEVMSALLRAATPIMAASGYPAYVLTFSGAARVPRLVAALSAPASANFRTWVLNTRKGALTEYSGWAFNSFAVFNGVLLGASAGGLVSLGTQDLDGAAAIDAVATTGKEDFGSSWHKRVPRIYAGIACDGDARFSTITTEGGTRTYALDYNRIDGIQQRRIPVGKGPRSRYFQFSVANVAGSDLSLNDILVYPVHLRRRVQ